MRVEEPISEVFDQASDWNEREGWSSAAAAWLARGAATGAILCMPLGPLGFMCGGIAGGGLTVAFGLLADWVRFTSKRRQALSREAQLEHMLRWAEFVFSRSEDPPQVFLYLVSEMESTVRLAPESRTAAAINKRFKEFLVRWDVQSVASDCLVDFFSHWRTATPQEVANCRRLCHTCSKAFWGEKRVPRVYDRMRGLLQEPEVHRLFASVDNVQAASSRDDWAIIADLKGHKVEQLFKRDVAIRFGLVKEGRKSEPNRALSDYERLSSAPIRSASSRLFHTVAPDSANTAPAVDNLSLEIEQNIAHPLHQSSLTIQSAASDLDIHQPTGPALSGAGTNRSPAMTEGQHAASLKRQWTGTTGFLVPSRCPHPFLRDHSGVPEVAASDDHVPIEIGEGSASPSPSPMIVSEDISPPERRRKSSEVVASPKVGDEGGSEVGMGEEERSVSIPILVATPAGGAAERETEEVAERHRAASSASKLRSQASLRELRDEIRRSINEAASQSGHTDQDVLGQTARRPPEEPAEQRFFKSLQDLIDFSPELKHKIPIGKYEFEFLNELEPEIPNDKTWDKVSDKNKTRIYKRIVTVAGSDLVMVKGYAAMDGIPAEWVLWNIRDTPRRTSWDKTFDGFLLVEGDIQGNEMVYNAIRAPWPATDRDFLQWRRTVFDAGDVIKILHRSAEHPGFPESDSSKIIRAESLISAYIIRPRGPDSCDLFLVTQTDIKGMVPRWLVNATAAKAPQGWIDNLRKACRDSVGWGRPIPAYSPRPLFANGIKVHVAS